MTARISRGNAVHRALLALILASSLAMKLHHLGHAAVKPLDEVFHAIVARNLLHHPLVPTLVDRPYLQYDPGDWQANHVWLHKPPMALWQIAISYALLGVNTWALRLPSALLSTAAVGLTYLIGAELLDRAAGLIAAALQAFNPVVLMLVQGYLFSDHVDISLLFWTELSIYFLCRALRTGRRVDLLICGIAQGLGFLSKTWPALIVTGVAVVAWLLPHIRLGRREDSRIGKRSLLLILAATACVVLPWMFYTALRFPREYAVENLEILHHLNANVEGWAAPWDRLAFDYLISVFYVFYPAVLAAVVVMLWRALLERQTGLWLVLAWGLGVMLPNLLATSKTMSATLIGWPAMWLLLGYLISLALRGDRLALGVWLGAMLLAVFTLNNRSIPAQGWGYGPPGAASILHQHLWVLWHALAALMLGVLFAMIDLRPAVLRCGVAIAAAATLVLFVCSWRGNHPRGYVQEAWAVTQINKQQPSFAAIGAFAHRLPVNAAFLVEEQSKLENKLIEFATNRSCYALDRRPWQYPATELFRAGALPYLVSAKPQPLPLVFVDEADHRAVYACNNAARAAALAAR